MSTRGCVAIGNENSWRGVYNHYDSYPTGLGKDVWREVQGNYDVFVEDLLKFTDWEEYKNKGVCKYCGRSDRGQPHSIDGVVDFLFSDWCYKRRLEEREAGTISEEGLETLENLEKLGYPDPEAKWHEHTLDEQSVEEAQMTETEASPLFIEWVYVIDPGTQRFIVLAHMSDFVTKGQVRCEDILRDDGYTDYGHCAYKHVKVWEQKLSDPEPDWNDIDEISDNMNAQAHAEAIGITEEDYRNLMGYIIDNTDKNSLEVVKQEVNPYGIRMVVKVPYRNGDYYAEIKYSKEGDQEFEAALMFGTSESSFVGSKVYKYKQPKAIRHVINNVASHRALQEFVKESKKERHPFIEKIYKDFHPVLEEM